MINHTAEDVVAKIQGICDNNMMFITATTKTTTMLRQSSSDSDRCLYDSTRHRPTAVVNTVSRIIWQQVYVNEDTLEF